MSESCFIRVPKNDLKLKRAHEFSGGIFIDNSGSTSSHLPSTGKSIIEAELALCQLKEFNHIVIWDTSASICQDISKVRASGGTEPTAIFQNPKTQQAFDDSEIVLFVTDGEISPSSVTAFGRHTEHRLSKALIICIIVNKKLTKPSQINVSVVAPLMMASNVLCLFHDGQTFYTLASKGHISQYYPTSTSLETYEELNTVDLRELFEKVPLYEYEKLPKGYIPVRENEQEIFAVDLNQLLQSNDLQSASTITEEDWKSIIQYGKIANQLSNIRTFISRLKAESIREEKEKSRQTFDFTYSKQRDELISRIVQLKMSENDHSDELTELRRQLSEVTDRANLEELNYLKYLKEHLHSSRRYWNEIEALVHEQEKGSYSLNDFNFSSNRANRAKMLTDDDDDETNETSNILDHSGVPQIECSICMEEGPLVLWLQSPSDLEDTTNDFIINFPLQGNEKLSSCFVANPVCGICAKSYVASMSNSPGGLITLYRQACHGFIPLNWSNESNRRFAYRSLCRILSGNRMLHHLSMLLLAMLDDFQSNWFDETMKEYLLNQIINNLWTTDTFSDEGTRMKFVDALKIIVHQSQPLLRQPIKAVCRILKFSSMFHQIDRDVIIMILRKRLALLALEKQCSISKHGPEHLTSIQQHLSGIIFETLCGIPQQNSLRSIDFFNESFRSFLDPSHRQLIEAFQPLAKRLSLDIDQTFPSSLITFILYLLTTIPLHDRPMKLFQDFALKHRLLRDQIDLQWEDIRNYIEDQLFSRFYESENITPSYAIHLGPHSCPSKFFFGIEPLWDKKFENQRVPLLTLIQNIQEKLNEKLENHFGSVNPNQYSAHIPVHSMVASVLQRFYPTDDDINEEMIVKCLLTVAETRGNRGNIYSTIIFPEIVLLIEDFLQFRRRAKDFTVPDEENTTKSVRHKVLSELLAAGMIYDSNEETVLFEPSKLTVPRLLRSEESKFDFQELKERVQQRYLAQRNAKESEDQTKQTCMNIELKEFLEFDFKLGPDQLLPLWAEEQKNIVSSVITDQDQFEEPLKYIAGLDISFVKINDQAVACMIIFEYPSLNIVAKISANCRMKIPYIPGYLAFREAPVFMKLIDVQKEYCPHLTPQLILMDGNGVWHPRRAGIASHFGVLSGIPCFGVSKNVLVADGITREKIEELLAEKAPKENDYIEVIGDSGEILGLAYNVTGFVKNAVYISVGHKITLPTALKIFESVTKYRICEPIRQADLLSREMVAKIS